MDFLKESFVQASLATASLCGLNAGHIWSNYLTRKQLSVILKGEVFQLSKPLKPFGFTAILPPKLCCSVRLGREEDVACACCAELRQLLCSLVCRGLWGLIRGVTSACGGYCQCHLCSYGLERHHVLTVWEELKVR